jgi:hypothetical protein
MFEERWVAHGGYSAYRSSLAATFEFRLVFRGSPRRMIDQESQQPSRRPLLRLRRTVLAKVFLALLGAPTSLGTSLLGLKWVQPRSGAESKSQNPPSCSSNRPNLILKLRCSPISSCDDDPRAKRLR